MFKEPDREIEDDEEVKEEPQGWNPALRKKRRRRRKDNRIKNWIIQENDSKTLFSGTVEGGVTSSYMLMVKVPNKNEFQMFPVEDWFRFKKPISYPTLTLQEAESLAVEKKRAVERWLMKHEKKDGNDVAPSASMITGALRTVKPPDDDDGGTIFAEPKAPRRRGGAIAKRASEVDATGDDGGDFTEIFSDDEGQQEVEKTKNDVASESSEDEFEDDATKKPLTDEGKALQDLVKRTKEQSENPTAAATADANRDDSSDDETKQDKDTTVVKRFDFYGNPVKETVPAVTAAGADGNGAAAASGAAATSTEADSLKRKHGVDDGDKPGAKKHQTAPTTKASAVPKLTEALIQEELIRYGGRMKTKDLIKKLKKLLVTADDKALFRDIVRTICDVEEDPVDGRYMVLKPQFR
ncbi:hypothetical protein DYB32_003510 [Aphanomyces invadans]|uniref:Transcription initiation factor IIF subunit alpha n=1 Tax=Aphanomyces invadans TaxID=157072 RepID=A0A418B0E0_9STRA|nr:hypothetical protein DYB32_003510 [Aphanomyces invadans]